MPQFPYLKKKYANLLGTGLKGLGGTALSGSPPRLLRKGSLLPCFSVDSEAEKEVSRPALSPCLRQILQNLHLSTQRRPCSGDLLTLVIMRKLKELIEFTPAGPQPQPRPSNQDKPKINRGLLKGGAQLFVTRSTRTQLASAAPSSCVSLCICVDARSHTVYQPAPPPVLRSLNRTH